MEIKYSYLFKDYAKEFEGNIFSIEFERFIRRKHEAFIKYILQYCFDECYRLKFKTFKIKNGGTKRFSKQTDFNKICMFGYFMMLRQAGHICKNKNIRNTSIQGSCFYDPIEGAYNLLTVEIGRFIQ
jgi:hypothetical protein